MAALTKRHGAPIPREAVGRDVRRGASRAPVGRLAREVVQHHRIGLTVDAVTPGLIETEMTAAVPARVIRR